MSLDTLAADSFAINQNSRLFLLWTTAEEIFLPINKHQQCTILDLVDSAHEKTREARTRLHLPEDQRK